MFDVSMFQCCCCCFFFLFIIVVVVAFTFLVSTFDHRGYFPCVVSFTLDCPNRHYYKLNCETKTYIFYLEIAIAVVVVVVVMAYHFSLWFHWEFGAKIRFCTVFRLPSKCDSIRFVIFFFIIFSANFHPRTFIMFNTRIIFLFE